MKKIILLIIISSMFSVCYSQPIPKAKYDSLYTAYRKQKVNDSLEIQYLNYKLNRVRYYVKIVNKNKTQQKFLLGWLNRSLK